MVDKIKNIPAKILEWWKKFGIKQKTIIISATAVVVLTFAILALVLSRPQMVVLTTCESTYDASQVDELLTGKGIEHEVSEDGLKISVNKKDLSQATLVIGAEGIPATGPDLDKVFDGGFSTTEADKDKKYALYKEEYIAETIEAIDVVKKAKVQLSIPKDDGTIIAKDQDTYAGVMLTLNGELSEDTAQGLAKFVATVVGNDDSGSIVIMDSKGTVLYTGESTDSPTGYSSTQLQLKNKYESAMRSKVNNILINTKLYDYVEVAPNLSLDFSVINKTDTVYTPADGQDQGLLDSRSTYTNETNGGTSGVPGTDSNDDTTYEILDEAGSSSTTEEINEVFKPNVSTTETQILPGAVKTEESSISVIANRYTVYDEEEMEKQGTLGDLTFDEFQAQNGEMTKLDVDEEVYQTIAMATGIDRENIQIQAYDIPFFQPKDASDSLYSNIMMIAILVLIVALLGFVIFKSTRPVVVSETTPELSVEDLLATTKEAEELEEVGFNDKSEARKMIEKFILEQPEAAALLLRNWLNEDWE